MFQTIFASRTKALLYALIALLFFSTTLATKTYSFMLFDDTPNFQEIKNTAEKKQQFFDFLYPHIVEANKQLRLERAKIKRIIDNTISDGAETEELPPYWQHWYLKSQARLYRIDEEQEPKKIAMALLKKIDIIPPALVLAQAANESAWGTSRFAREGNNYFGLWCYTKGCGLVPKHRNKGSTHEVASFSNVQKAVIAYSTNINRHKAYAPLRAIRLQLQAQNKAITGAALAPGLIHYSERRELYVQFIQELIRGNKLDERYPITDQ